MRPFRVIAPLFGVLALACSSEPASNGGAGGGGGAGTTGAAGHAGTSGGSAGTSGGTGGDGVGGSSCSAEGGASGEGGDATSGPATCDATSYADASLPSVMVGKVEITVHDTDGALVVGQPVFVCGIDVCSSREETDSDGVAVVDVTMAVKKPALKFGDALHYAELAVLLDGAQAGVTFPDLTLPALPVEGAPLAACSTARSNGVALTLAPNATLTFDDIAYATPDSQGLRAAELPPEQFPDGIDHGAGLERIFTLAPLNTVICPPAALELPNSANWAPGTRVEFLVQGFAPDTLLVDQPFAPYGEWQSVATGVVSADGATLRTTHGGLPIISNVGVRRL